MSAYNKSCAASKTRAGQTESEAMLRLFCTYDNLTRFVLPLCSAVRSRPDPEAPVTATNCIVDISGVGILQFLRLSAHMQAASRLATAHYPETLGRTYVSHFLSLETELLIDERSTDHRCSFLLPHNLGLDKQMV